ncbi:phage tail sheath C-terminal domain-containing protein [Tenacibaculum tangerinum]|uniref:Phage tail sheath C-terminal domain-containing protein n=1 Tax=Tenacibaculum tangerinum TaxID=3038772 RepID=A0ABY8L2S2_9FLAO|nr:phage tail sheath C-terminal domain-containing protein [Tenacibaculum tangerinum]WGH74165.1 phage tail sheath C-terminal domain-containing protein [Tenacibaculum tangerinum]
MSAYKTPGVYIEEIVKFPPSVAQVETAIPAFIGYTEKATKKVKGDLKATPTRISSMLEYEMYFGVAKPEIGIKVTVEDEKVSVEAPNSIEKSPFLMYYSLQLYFANGGGPCYIVSVGRYGNINLLDGSDLQIKAITSVADFNTGLAEVRKIDEVTLIVFPDATALTDDTTFYDLYKAALTQCNELQDRFTIIDTRACDPTDPAFPNIGILRDKIGSEKDYLKYGAAYYPFLKTILDYRYDESSTDVTISTALPRNIQAEAQAISTAIDTTDLSTFLTDIATLSSTVDGFTGPDDDDDAVAEVPNVIAKINSIKHYLGTLEVELNKAVNLARTDGSATAEANALDTWITDEIETLQVDLNKAIDRLNNDDSKITVLNEISEDTGNSTSLQKVLGTHNDSTDSIVDKINTLIASGELQDLIDNLPTSSGSALVKTLNTIKTEDDALYNQIKAEISNLPLVLPPSSAMAGVYARVDSDRGVWKAPANVSLNYVIEPLVNVSHEDQQNLNVDTVAGKSINAIRSFVGKGNLVWGARTLAGNDNEWRYISVRRFFNMAEESIKKATEQFVFEPNDKNTWVRVKAMIDNFLTQQWRAGALAGPTPDKAFYVSVGLGETMTAQDVLEGNMILEIGMAVVRPAEFIILKFSHKMQEA